MKSLVLLLWFLLVSTAQDCKHESLSNKGVEIILDDRDNTNSIWETTFKVTPDGVDHWAFSLKVELSLPEEDTPTLANLILSKEQNKNLKLSGSVDGKSIMDKPFLPNHKLFRSSHATFVDLRKHRNGMMLLTFDDTKALEEWDRFLTVFNDLPANNSLSLILKNRTGAGGFLITYDCLDNRPTTTAIVEATHLKTSRSIFDESNKVISTVSEFPAIEEEDSFKYLIIFSILVFTLALLIFICIVKTNKSRNVSRDISHKEPRFVEQHSGNLVNSQHPLEALFPKDRLQKTSGNICPLSVSSVDHQRTSDEHSFKSPKLIVCQSFIPAYVNFYSNQIFPRIPVALASFSDDSPAFVQTYPTSYNLKPSKKISAIATNTHTTRTTFRPTPDESGMMNSDFSSANRTDAKRLSLAEHIYECANDLETSSQAHSSSNSIYGMTFAHSYIRDENL